MRTPAPRSGRFRRILAGREKSEYTAQTHRDWAMKQIQRFDWEPRDFLKLLRDWPRIWGPPYCKQPPPAGAVFAEVWKIAKSLCKRPMPAAMGHGADPEINCPMPLQPMPSYAPGRFGRGAQRPPIHFANEEASANNDGDPEITDSVTAAEQYPHHIEGDPGTQNRAKIPI